MAPRHFDTGRLPAEILRMISQHANKKTAMNMRLANKAFSNLARTGVFGKLLVRPSPKGTARLQKIACHSDLALEIKEIEMDCSEHNPGPTNRPIAQQVAGQVTDAVQSQTPIHERIAGSLRHFPNLNYLGFEVLGNDRTDLTQSAATFFAALQAALDQHIDKEKEIVSSKLTTLRLLMIAPMSPIDSEDSDNLVLHAFQQLQVFSLVMGVVDDRIHPGVTGSSGFGSVKALPNASARLTSTTLQVFNVQALSDDCGYELVLAEAPLPKFTCLRVLHLDGVFMQGTGFTNSIQGSFGTLTSVWLHRVRLDEGDWAKVFESLCNCDNLADLRMSWLTYKKREPEIDAWLVYPPAVCTGAISKKWNMLLSSSWEDHHACRDVLQHVMDRLEASGESVIQTKNREGGYPVAQKDWLMDLLPLQYFQQSTSSGHWSKSAIDGVGKWVVNELPNGEEYKGIREALSRSL